MLQRIQKKHSCSALRWFSFDIVKVEGFEIYFAEKILVIFEAKSG